MAVNTWELLSDGQMTGVREWMRYDPVTKEMEVRSEQIVDPMLETAKANYNQTDERARWKDMNHVGILPLEVWWHHKKVHGVDLMRDHDALRRWLNDPDNRHFRTRPGRI